jgi:transglutaminase-like putative cysteine protease
LNDHGELTIAFTDGRDLLAYADRAGLALHLGTIAPPYERVAFGNDDLLVDLSVRGTKARKGVVVCTAPLDAAEEAAAPAWTLIAPGHLVLVRQGAVVADVGPEPMGPLAAPAALGSLVSASVAARALSRPAPAKVARWLIKHRTAYKYVKPVERSSHLIRLTPVDDRLQHVLEHDVKVSVQGQVKDYDDVFGNRSRRLFIESSFTELVLEATSLVEVRDIDPLDFRPLKARSTIPLVWMPWQRQINAPFLLPPELPETQLDELTEYAMSFVKRNDFDLLDTLIDINATIYKEYEYRQGSTTVFTTPFEVYTNRRGVCQDFTNLFICLARLLGVPARYVCGYIYTGPKHENQVQSEASHAWVQLYLPEAGWKGFDPTNGILTQTSHIRVAVGRNYIDATPTSGTIYVGGGPETLEVSVTVEPAEAK